MKVKWIRITVLYSVFQVKSVNHSLKDGIGTISIEIGINLWFAPQISEHWPKKSPGNEEWINVWFNRPGVASTLIPSLGRAHACRTSFEPTKTRVETFIGKTTLLSTSKSR